MLTKAQVAAHELSHCALAGIATMMFAPKKYTTVGVYLDVKVGQGEAAFIVGHENNPLAKPIVALAALGPLLMTKWARLQAGPDLYDQLKTAGMSQEDLTAFKRCQPSYNEMCRALGAGTRLWRELPRQKLIEILATANLNNIDAPIPLELLVPKSLATKSLSAADRAFQSSIHNPKRAPRYV